jgi:hypothetical protein
VAILHSGKPIRDNKKAYCNGDYVPLFLRRFLWLSSDDFPVMRNTWDRDRRLESAMDPGPRCGVVHVP